MAIADAVAASWETKATFFTWRPFFAVHEADLDGDPDTEPDATWTPRTISIGASPEWTSGLSTFSGAASAVVDAFYFPAACRSASRRIPPLDPAATDSPLAAAIEAGRSRIYQGIHFQFSMWRAAGRGAASASKSLSPACGSVSIARRFACRDRASQQLRKSVELEGVLR